MTTDISQPDKIAIDPRQTGALKRFNFAAMKYVPQELQRQVHDSTAPVVIVSGGEGSGKSVVTSAEIAARYGLWKRVLFVCYKNESAKNEADYLYQFLKNFGAASSYRAPKDGSIELSARNGGIVESVSTYAEGERAVSGTGKSYDIIAMIEAGKQSYSVFKSCLLRVSRTGGLLLLSGTIEKSEPWFADIVTRLQGENTLGAEVKILPTWENRILYPLGENDPKILAIRGELGEDLFLERCAGRPSPQHSLLFKEFSYLTHVFDWCVYDPSLPVEVAVDPGYSGSHYSVNFIQKHPRAYTRRFYPALPDVPLTDVFVFSDLYLDHAVHEEVIQQVEALPWASHVLGGVGDVVMKTHPMADRAPVDVWKAKTRNQIVLRGQLVGINDGIDRHHTFLKDPVSAFPRLFFNPSCKGIVEYSRWKRKEIGENLYGDPEDKNCDCMKAVQYWLIDQFGRVESKVLSGAISTGTRVGIGDAKELLPQEIRVTSTQPNVTRVPVATRQSYLVVPRAPRVHIGGMEKKPPPDRIV